MMNAPDTRFEWRTEFEALAVKYASLGIAPDLGALAIAEAWGLWLFLRSVESGARQFAAAG